MREFITVDKTYKQMVIQGVSDDVYMIHFHSPDEWCWVLSKGWPGKDKDARAIDIGVHMDYREHPPLLEGWRRLSGWIMGDCHEDGSVSVQLVFERDEDVKE